MLNKTNTYNERLVRHLFIHVSSSLLLLCAVYFVSGCGGGGSGGGWSSGDVTPATSDTGTVQGYVYQQAAAATRGHGMASRAILLPLSGAVVTVGGRNAITDSSGFYSVAAVPAGTQTLSLAATGFNTVTLSVTVTAGKTLTATPQNDGTYALTPVGSGYLDLSSTPSGAGVQVGGTSINVATPNTLTLAAASYALSFTKEGYESQSQSVTVGAGATQTISVTLTPRITAISAVTSSLTVSAGGSQTPVVTCTYYDGTSGACQTLSWTSQNTAVALVDGTTGQVTGAAPGTTTIVGARTASGVSVAIPVTVLAAGDTLSSVSITSGGSAGDLSLSSGASATFNSACLYSLSGMNACDSSCTWSSSNAAAGTIDESSGQFTCTSAGGSTSVQLSCNGLMSNAINVGCAITSASTILRVHGAADANGDGAADGAFSSTVSVDPGDDLIIRVKVENGTDITGFRTDLSISSNYISLKTQADGSCSSGLGYDTSQICIANFGTALSPSNPFFGNSATLDTTGVVAYTTGSAVESLECTDAAKEPKRLDCAISTRKVSDVQPSADGSNYFVYFIVDTKASAASGSSTTVSIDTSTLQIMSENGVEVIISDGQVYSLSVEFN